MDVELSNHKDRHLAEDGHLDADAVRECTIEGWVDTGATQVVIPKVVADSLGLPFRIKTSVRFADGRRETQDVVGDLWLRVCGRESVFSAVVEPGREDVLIGAIVLEELDLLADPKAGTCYPRDPEEILTVVE